uniref:PemK-like protein n=1 Tax=Panagrellus redivivus TaxID=6233 RepID=A0A7E4V938_PANRE
MPFFKYQNDIMPFSNLTYGFKNRLIQLARINDATKISVAFPGTNIRINNTLILNLESVESYDRVVPLIVGPYYSRLVLHGQFTWVQVKRLVHSNVKQVRLMNRITVKPREYDDVVQFVLRFSRHFENK